MGLQGDLGMSGNDFSWLATAFFIAYAVAEIPQGALLQRFPVSKVLGFNVLFWGIILCCSSATKSFSGMLALRVLLGLMEAVIGKSRNLRAFIAKLISRQLRLLPCTRVCGIPAQSRHRDMDFGIVVLVWARLSAG